MTLLSANREDSEFWRIIRLKSVLLASGVRPFLLHDHKGFLTVHWNLRPTIKQKTAIEKAWEVVGNECVENVEHIYEISKRG